MYSKFIERYPKNVKSLLTRCDIKVIMGTANDSV